MITNIFVLLSMCICLVLCFSFEIILSSETLSPALQQWLDVILEYRFVVQHRPGIMNQLPDSLSRMYSALYQSTWGVPAANVMSTDMEGNLLVNHSLTPVVAHTAASSEAGGGEAQHKSQTMKPLGSTLETIDLAVELERRGMKAPSITTLLKGWCSDRISI
jgi:hypothetical protein